MSATTNQNVIIVDPNEDDKTEVLCTPFEPHHSDYAGEKFLAIFYRGKEEAFVVLTADQAAEPAQLLTPEVTR